MNSFSDNDNLEAYVPVYSVVPDKWEEARPFLIEQLRRIATAVNIREIGWFVDQEVLSGKSFIPGSNNVLEPGTSQLFRSVLRKVIDFGALPNAGTKSVPHGIVFDDNFTLVALWGAATDPVGIVAFQIPFANPVSSANSVALSMNATNVSITTGINRSAFTRCFVVIEYMQEL